MFRITVTNDCPAPRAQLPILFGGFKDKAAAEKTAEEWNRHIAPFNRVMKQNVVYAVTETK